MERDMGVHDVKENDKGSSAYQASSLAKIADEDSKNENTQIWLTSFDNKHTCSSIETYSNQITIEDLFNSSSTLRNSNEILLKLDYLRLHKELCDFDIHTSDGKIIPTHSVVLACCSPVLYEFIKTSYTNASYGKIKYNSDGNSEIWDILLHFLYTGNLDIAKECVEAIKEVAKTLRITIPEQPPSNNGSHVSGSSSLNKNSDDAASDFNPGFADVGRDADSQPRTCTEGDANTKRNINLNINAVPSEYQWDVDPVVIKTEPISTLPDEDNPDIYNNDEIGEPSDQKSRKFPAARFHGRWVKQAKLERINNLKNVRARPKPIEEADPGTHAIQKPAGDSSKPKRVTRSRLGNDCQRRKSGDDYDPQTSSNDELDDPNQHQQTTQKRNLDPDYKSSFGPSKKSKHVKNSVNVTEAQVPLVKKYYVVSPSAKAIEKWIVEEKCMMNTESRGDELNTSKEGHSDLEHNFDTDASSLKREICNMDTQPNSANILDNLKTENSVGISNQQSARQDVHDKLSPHTGKITRKYVDENSDTEDEDVDPRLCILCGDDFVNERQFVKHSQDKHSGVQNRCYVCFRWCTSIKNFTQHTKKCVEERQCTICEKAFINNASMLKHMKLRHTVLPFKCLKCDQGFETKDKGISHFEKRHIVNSKKVPQYERMETKSEDKPKLHCPLCSFKCVRLSPLERHIWVTHKKRKFYQCEICGLELGESSSYYSHKFTHKTERPHKCDICNKTYKHPDHLRTHKNLHSEPKHMCDFCGKQFHQKKHMNVHRRTHTGEKPCICLHCGVGFAQTTSLKYHLKHTHGLDKNPAVVDMNTPGFGNYSQELDINTR